jgi:hypothetical protein
MNAMVRQSYWRFMFTCTTFTAFTAATAHELPANRLSLVLRDDAHIALTYYIDYPKALQQALEPKRTFNEFLLMYSAMPAANFQQAMAKAQAIFASETVIKLNNGEALAITAWRWPNAVSTQAALQQRVMQSVVAASEHQHEAAIEIQANATAKRKIDEISVALPKSLGSVLVVSYKPKQTPLLPTSAPLKIKF